MAPAWIWFYDNEETTIAGLLQNAVDRAETLGGHGQPALATCSAC